MVGGLPEPLVLRDPAICFRFGCEADGDFRPPAWPDDLNHEAVALAMHHPVACVRHLRSQRAADWAECKNASLQKGHLIFPLASDKDSYFGAFIV